MDRSGIVVFSGGSAANTLVDVFGNVAADKQNSLNYIIPISDNGGSTSELIRFFGGPGIGDIRSRLVRLIPEHGNGGSRERTAIKTLFNHRLASLPDVARFEWLDIVEGRHDLWIDIPTEKRELIRSFLNTINLEIVKRTRPSSSFNFQSASVGNLFLTAARIFTGSFESAIYILAAITDVPSNINVIPAINTNFSHHICAGLHDGTSIVGQNSISHPSSNTFSTPGTISPIAYSRNLARELIDCDSVEDATLPGSLPTLRKQHIEYEKGRIQDLPAKIERIWYINPYGQEIRPHPNPKVLDALMGAQCVIYSIGSLYTSIIPSLILREVGEVITAPHIRFKILILNGSIDRETGPSSSPYSAKDFVAAIAKACGSSRAPNTLVQDSDLSNYVTHLVHLEGEGTPSVGKEELKALGIETVRLYGRKSMRSGMVYDGKALAQALEAIMGRRDPRTDKSRRNTLQH